MSSKAMKARRVRLAAGVQRVPAPDFDVMPHVVDAVAILVLVPAIVYVVLRWLS